MAASVPHTPNAQGALAGTPLARAAHGLDACVHCGFCLNACPTYLALEDENDSPRGRLVLMRAMIDGDLALDDRDATLHIDRCLGCRGCESACPSGVPYGHLLEATRATMATVRRLPLAARAVLFVFARPRMLALAMAAARALRATGLPRLLGRLRGARWFPAAMLASTARTRARHPAEVPPAGQHRAAVSVFRGCVMEGLFAPVNRATERVLRVQGYGLVPAPGQRCCGALHAHAGDRATAQRLARANIEAFEASAADFIVVNAAGCGAMIREYAALLDDDPEWNARAARVAERTRDVSELLADAGPAPAPSESGARISVAYDAPCHLQHAQRIVAPPLAVLRAIASIQLVPLDGADLCCGSAGIFNLIDPHTSGAVLAPKLAAIEATRAAVVATGNPGCLMQIGAGLLRNGSRAIARHPVELLAEGYDSAKSSPPPPKLVGRARRAFVWAMNPPYGRRAPPA